VVYPPDDNAQQLYPEEPALNEPAPSEDGEEYQSDDAAPLECYPVAHQEPIEKVADAAYQNLEFMLQKFQKHYITSFMIVWSMLLWL